MLKKVFINSIIMILIFFLLTTGCGKKHHPKEHPFPPMDMSNALILKMSRDLDMTNEQKEVLKKIYEEIRAKKEEMKDKSPDYKERIISLIKSDKITKEQVLEVLKGPQRYKEEMDDFISEKLVELHNILTTEQKEKLVEKVRNFAPPKRIRKHD